MMLLQLSAAQGPAECCLALVKLLPHFLKEARAAQVQVNIVEEEPGPKPGTLRSIIFSLEGQEAAALAQAWEGSFQWICRSPYRPQHGRKNWFIGGRSFNPPPASLEGEVRFEAMRSSGPGGQHVNKTNSAIRATHLATGLQVKVQRERSQHANKQLALLLLGQRLAQQEEAQQVDLRAARRLAHHQLERGHPSRIFTGENFTPL